MNQNPAAEWLIADFEDRNQAREAADDDVRPHMGGVAVARPMIQFVSVWDTGIAMRTGPADYKDDQRWWL